VGRSEGRAGRRGADEAERRDTPRRRCCPSGSTCSGTSWGTVLLGLALWRAQVVGRWAAVLVVASQPLHFVAAMVLQNHVMDFASWGMQAVGFVAVAVAILRCRRGMGPSAPLRNRRGCMSRTRDGAGPVPGSGVRESEVLPEEAIGAGHRGGPVRAKRAAHPGTCTSWRSCRLLERRQGLARPGDRAGVVGRAVVDQDRSVARRRSSPRKVAPEGRVALGAPYARMIAVGNG
jgi:hypothetical protein